MYDYIFIGTSGPMLYYINYLKKKNFIKNTDKIIIFEQNKLRIGGAWYSISNEFCKDIDHANHFIPLYNQNSNIIIDSLKKLDIEVNKIDNKNLIIKYDNYKHFREKGLLYAKNGWHSLINKLYENLNEKNFEFIFEKIDNINILKEYVEINYLNKIIKTKKLYIPSYISINEININNDTITLLNDLDNKMTTFHIIIYLKTEKIKYDENFHAIYGDVDIFDRVMFITSKKNIISNNINLISILRFSRSYKNKINTIKNIEDEAYKFLIKNNLIYESIVKGYDITEYEFYFRYKCFEENKNKIKNKIIENNFMESIEMIDTRDLGNIINLFN